MPGASPSTVGRDVLVRPDGQHDQDERGDDVPVRGLGDPDGASVRERAELATDDLMASATTSDHPRPDLLRAMAAIRDDLGFETASLFAPPATGWELLDRAGPVRPWHGVLDPAAFAGAPEPAAHPDVRTVPGIGGRLAGLGCASVAVLPLPDGSRLVLDSAATV